MIPDARLNCTTKIDCRQRTKIKGYFYPSFTPEHDKNRYMYCKPPNIIFVSFTFLGDFSKPSQNQRVNNCKCLRSTRPHKFMHSLISRWLTFALGSSRKTAISNTEYVANTTQFTVFAFGCSARPFQSCARDAYEIHLSHYWHCKTGKFNLFVILV